LEFFFDFFRRCFFFPGFFLYFVVVVVVVVIIIDFVITVVAVVFVADKDNDAIFENDINELIVDVSSSFVTFFVEVEGEGESGDADVVFGCNNSPVDDNVECCNDDDDDECCNDDDDDDDDDGDVESVSRSRVFRFLRGVVFRFFLSSSSTKSSSS